MKTWQSIGALGVITVLVPSASVAQSRAEIQSRYPAVIRESYWIRPNIDATFTYSDVGTVCRVEIAPSGRSEGRNDEAALLSREDMDALLDEVAPQAGRGTRRGEGDAEWGANGMLITLYEYAEVREVTRYAAGERQIVSATVLWKDTCAN